MSGNPAKKATRASAALRANEPKKPAKKAKGAATAGAPASPVGSVRDWREETLKRIRTLIQEAAPDVIEERKWKKPSNGMAGVPVWSHNGIVCTGESYNTIVKLTFARGASLPDPSRLFNSSLEGNTRRAIDILEGATIDADAFKALVRAAVAQNAASKKST